MSKAYDTVHIPLLIQALNNINNIIQTLNRITETSVNINTTTTTQNLNLKINQINTTTKLNIPTIPHLQPLPHNLSSYI